MAVVEFGFNPTLSIEDFAKRYMEPVQQRLAEKAVENLAKGGISRSSCKFKRALREELYRLCYGPELLATMKEMFPVEEPLLRVVKESLHGKSH